MARREGISLYHFNRMFPDEESARKHIERTLLGVDSKYRCCPRCGSVRTSVAKHATMPYRCKDCDKRFSVRVAESVDSKTLEGMIDNTVDSGSIIYTDENRGYSGLTRKGYKHETVNHGIGEYIKEQVHTNGLESFWSMFKRGYIGTYHYMSRKHLQRYINEYAGRHNIRPLDTIKQIDNVIKEFGGKRLKYKELI